jgi:hypothetical protein
MAGLIWYWTPASAGMTGLRAFGRPDPPHPNLSRKGRGDKEAYFKAPLLFVTL